MASFEEAGIRSSCPRTWPKLAYASALQWNEAVVLVCVNDFHEFRHQLAGEFWRRQLLGAGISRRGNAWAFFAWARFSEGLRAGFRQEDARRERMQEAAEHYAHWKAAKMS
jgi:hypothetical protein